MNKLKHLAVIMDGNRRWAKIHSLPSIKGHEKGAKNLFTLCDWCITHKISFLSVFVFSTYNWNRTELEIFNLFKLMKNIFYKEIEKCIEKNIKVNIIGDYSAIDNDCRFVLEQLKEKTKDCNGLTLNMAINYGGKEEIIYAIKNMLSQEENVFENLSDKTLSKYLYVKDMPNIDLIVRSGGFQRLSNFMIWEASCAELYFTPTLWPDFDYKSFLEAIDFYYNVEIKNGK